MDNKPGMVQMFDKYIDREYYKVTSNFWGTIHTIVRTDRLKDSTELVIECGQLPESVMVNGEEYKLIKK